MQNLGSIFSQLAYAYQTPSVKGRIRVRLDDFKVEERLGFELTDSGEHVFLSIEKRGENTDYISSRLAAYAKVRSRDIGYAGLKDKNAVTKQWYSVHLPGKKTLDWSDFETDSIRILECRRHNRKLRKGALAANRFDIYVRDLIGAGRQQLEVKLGNISKQGVPNYFGPQRFGHQEQNIRKAVELFSGSIRAPDRHKRGLYLSAARSYIFNQMLSIRVAEHNWNRAILGDLFMLDGSNSYFKTEIIDQAIHRRIQMMDIHPSGVLWGKGEQGTTQEAGAIEQKVIEGNLALCRGLQELGLAIGRRSLRLPVNPLDWDFPDETSLHLRFDLPAGAYATSVLRELVYFLP